MSIRNETYKHLEDPFRLFGLTLPQWAMVAGGLGWFAVFVFHLAPALGIPVGPSITFGIMSGGFVPAISYAAAGFDGPAWNTVGVLWRWLLSSRRYLPGSGEIEGGYVVEAPAEKARPIAVGAVSAVDDLAGVWDE